MGGGAFGLKTKATVDAKGRWEVDDVDERYAHKSIKRRAAN